MTLRARLWIALILSFALGSAATALAFMLPGVDSAVLAAVGAVVCWAAMYGIAGWYQRKGVE